MKAQKSGDQSGKNDIDSMFPQKQLKYESSDSLFFIRRPISNAAPSLFTSLAYLLEPLTYSSLTANSQSLDKACQFMKKYASATILKFSDKFKAEELSNKDPYDYVKALEERHFPGSRTELKALSIQYEVCLFVI